MFLHTWGVCRETTPEHSGEQSRPCSCPQDDYVRGNQTSNGTATYFNGAMISATKERGQDEGEARGTFAWAAKFKELPHTHKKDSYFNAICFNQNWYQNIHPCSTKYPKCKHRPVSCQAMLEHKRKAKCVALYPYSCIFFFLAYFNGYFFHRTLK